MAEMAEGLPEGLFTNNIEAISQDIEKEDRVDVEGLTRLWRGICNAEAHPSSQAHLRIAYSTNKIVLANDVGQRLENFFWRLWSSEHLRTNVSGSRVAELFAIISEGNIIRTTPTSSPRASRLIPSLRRNQRPRVETSTDQSDESEDSQAAGSSETSSEPSDQSIDNNQGERRSGPSQPPTVEEEKGRRRNTSRPSPILKRPGIDTSVQSKTARILTPTWKTSKIDPAHDESNFPRKTVVPARSKLSATENPQDNIGSSAYSSTTLESEQLSSTSTLRATSPPRQKLSSSAKLSTSTTSGSSKVPKKKPGFVASSATTKRRPAMTRRKSSQSSSSNASKITSPKPSAQSSPPLAAGNDSTGLCFTPPSVTTRERPASVIPRGSDRPTSRSASPISSSPFRRPTRDHLPTATDEANPAPSHEDWLVDRNFRSKFVDKLGAEGSPFAPLTAKSTAATGVSGSFQATGSMFTSYGDSREPRNENTSESIGQGGNLGLVIEEEHRVNPAFPSSKSQLTSLLKEDKRKAADKPKRHGKGA